MKKIFFEVDLLGARGGMDQYVIPLLNSLSKISANLVLVTNNECSDITLSPAVKRLNYFTNFLKGNKLNNLMCYFYGLLRIVKDLLFRDKESQYIVHLHFFSYGLLDVLKILVFMPFKVEVISTIHDVSSFRKKGGADLFRNFILKKSDVLLVHNNYSKLALLQFFNAKNKIKILKHGNYCDFVELFPRRRVISDEESTRNFKVGFIGQIKKVKNLEFVLDALSELKGYSLIVKGKVSEYEESEIVSLINNVNITCRFKFGYLSNLDLINELRSLDIIVLSYKEIYQSGILLLAMSSGAIVLCSDLCAFKEIVSNGVNGFLYQEGNKASFQDQLNTIKNTPVADLEQIRKNSLEYVKSNYSWDSIAIEYKDLFL